MQVSLIKQAADAIRKASRVIAFTGAGISVESGIPPYRGPGGLWEKHDARKLDISYFRRNPGDAWQVISEIFYSHFSEAEPNKAHLALAQMEAYGNLQGVITQNIDNLHQKAGSLRVIEFHGNSQRLVCPRCAYRTEVTRQVLASIPPKCPECDDILKPDFVFFGEPIPIKAYQSASQETRLADIWLIIGTTGEVFPAAALPFEAKQNGKTIIEINIEPSNFTHQITDYFLQGSAAVVTHDLWRMIQSNDA